MSISPLMFDNNECLTDLDKHIFNFIKMLDNKDHNLEKPKPTELRVSTRSATCKINSQLILELVGSVIYANIQKNIIDGEDPNYLILGISMEGIELNTYTNKKKKKKKNKSSINTLVKTPSKHKTNFFNQCSIIVRPSIDRRPVNIKLFLNGSSSMTGCLESNDGRDAIMVLINELKKYPHVFVNEQDSEKIVIYDYKISMINSDYKINFKVDRFKLYNILTEQTKLLVTYEPERYPGVKISYYYNPLNKSKDGVCTCCHDLKCNGKGVNNTCKKITVAIFQSGSIIITGSRSIVQTEEAYHYTNKILLDNYSLIVKYSILDSIKQTETEKKESVDIKKKNPSICKKKVKVKSRINKLT